MFGRNVWSDRLDPSTSLVIWLADDDSSQNDYHKTFWIVKQTNHLPWETFIFPQSLVSCLFILFQQDLFVSYPVCHSRVKAKKICVWQIHNIKERSNRAVRELQAAGCCSPMTEMCLRRRWWRENTTSVCWRLSLEDLLCQETHTARILACQQPPKVDSQPQWDQKELLPPPLDTSENWSHFLSPELVFIRCKQSKHEGNSKNLWSNKCPCTYRTTPLKDFLMGGKEKLQPSKQLCSCHKTANCLLIGSWLRKEQVFIGVNC